MVTYKANQQKLFTLLSKQDKNAAVYIPAKFLYLIFYEVFPPGLVLLFSFNKFCTYEVLMRYLECQWNEGRW